MTVSERGNYQVAILFSIILHLSLVLIAFPMQLLSIPNRTEEVAVGIYEFTTAESPTITAEPEPEVAIVPVKQLPKPVQNQPKPAVQIGQQPQTGQPNQNSKPVANSTKVPVSFGDGTGMVLGFGQKPSYPKNAENEGSEGEVLVRVFIKTDGTVEGTKLIERSGDSRLDNAAVSSLNRNWTFKPNTEAYYIDIRFIFKNYESDYQLVKSATRP